MPAAVCRTRAINLVGERLTPAEELAKQDWLRGLRGSVASTAAVWQAAKVANRKDPVTERVTESVTEYNAGPPIASLVPPGHCVFGEEWTPTPLVKKQWIGHDTLLLTFGLQGAQSLGLSTCACLLARGAAPSDGGEPIIRPYTPVSTNAMLGAFQLMVKVTDFFGSWKHEPALAMSQQLARLPIGGLVDFKHIKFNVKLQYPFRARNIVMLVGGTGIAPMLQALHALLGTPTDPSRTTLLYSSKSQEDILAKGTLDEWEASHPDRLSVHHTLTREPEGSDWTGRRGRIDAALLHEQLPPPSDDVLIFVCGPPAMYDALSGPRTEPEALTGLLADMGYSAEQVVKF